MGKNFIKETKAELKKVIWPSRQDVINGTGVVVAMVAIVGVIILGFDFLSNWSVQQIMQVNKTSTNQIILDDHDHAHDHEHDEVVNETTNNVEENANTDVIPDNNTEVNTQTEVVNNTDAE